MSISATSGVVSNIDYQSLITQLVGIRRQSITQLQTDKKGLEITNSAYSNLSSRVKDLVTAADGLRNPAAFGSFKTTVSDSNAISASAGSGASYGSHSIVVSTLAKSHKVAADGVAAATSTIAAGAGSFTFQVGAGTAQSVPVDAATTLTSLKDSINALNAGVTASVVNDGSGPNPYRLILAGTSTGTSNSVTITQNDTSLVFSTTLQAAQDATFTVDAMSFTRQTNSASDIIPGVTLDLLSADPARTIGVTVSRDTDSISDNVKKLVDAYNGVVSYIKQNNRYDSDTKKAYPFFGDSVARSIADDLRRVFSSAAAGLPDTMNRLLHAGISTDREGVMSLDTSKLKNALNSNFDGVVSLFTKGATTTGFAELIHQSASSIDDFVDGRIKGRQDGLKKNMTRIDQDIRQKETQLVSYEEQLRAQFTGLEAMLASLKGQSNALNNYFGGA
ncbi:MAG: flagellar filament capping protein FliD [Deltaproteobacteria bacterium]|nr:flagellar filament capping protein FliD [Deltaproteobacteria bacterium]